MSDVGELKARTTLPPPSGPARAPDPAEEAEELRDTIAELRSMIACQREEITDLEDEVRDLNFQMETEPEPLCELRSAVQHIAWRARLDGQWPIAQELERAVEASR